MKKMNMKKYKIYKLVLTMLLVGFMSVFVGTGNYIAALSLFLISILIMVFLKKNTKGVFTDERMDNLAGKAAKIVLTIFTLLMAAAGIVLVSLREINSMFLILGNVLIFTECGMLLLYVALFKYFSRKK